MEREQLRDAVTEMQHHLKRCKELASKIHEQTGDDGFPCRPFKQSIELAETLLIPIEFIPTH